MRSIRKIGLPAGTWSAWAATGHLAKTIVTAIQNTSLPGRATVADLAGYQAVEREPLCLQLEQREICSFPPPSYGGVAVLEMLGILEKRRTAPSSFLDLGFAHDFIEAGRLAEADRMAIMGDPDVRPGNVRGLIEPDYLYLAGPSPSLGQARSREWPVFGSRGVSSNFRKPVGDRR